MCVFCPEERGLITSLGTRIAESFEKRFFLIFVLNFQNSQIRNDYITFLIKYSNSECKKALERDIDIYFLDIVSL